MLHVSFSSITACSEQGAGRSCRPNPGYPSVMRFFSSLPGGRPVRSLLTGLGLALLLLPLAALAQPTLTGLSPTRNLRNAPRAGNVALTFS